MAVEQDLAHLRARVGGLQRSREISPTGLGPLAVPAGVETCGRRVIVLCRSTSDTACAPKHE